MWLLAFGKYVKQKKKKEKSFTAIFLTKELNP